MSVEFEPTTKMSEITAQKPSLVLSADPSAPQVPEWEAPIKVYEAGSHGFPKGRILSVEGIGDDECVTNITGPFRAVLYKVSYTLIIGRVDKNDTEGTGELRFFVFNRGEGKLKQLPVDPIKSSEDPAVTPLGDQLGLTANNISRDSDNRAGLRWQPVLRLNHGENELTGLQEVLRGLEWSKDFRLCALSDGRIAVTDRPEREIVLPDGKKVNAKVVTLLVVDSLLEITPENLKSAKIVQGMTGEKGHWYGMGSMIELENGRLGCVAHKARMVGRNKEYDVVTGELDLEKGEWVNEKVIAKAKHVPCGKVKKIYDTDRQAYDEEMLYHVLFGNDQRFSRDLRKMFVYGGRGDAEAIEVSVDYPYSALPKRTPSFESFYLLQEN